MKLFHSRDHPIVLVTSQLFCTKYTVLSKGEKSSKALVITHLPRLSKLCNSGHLHFSKERLLALKDFP